MLKINPSLDEARDWLRENIGEGVVCPCCDQFAKVYKRQIHSTMARELIKCYSTARLDYFHSPTVLGALGSELAKLRYWGLVEEELVKRPDGGRAGFWRVTERGELFVHASLSVQKYALIYNGNVLTHDGDDVTIRECLGSKFDFDELMQTVNLPIRTSLF